MLSNERKKMIREKKGPVLLDTLTYRISGHSPSDASSYRSKEEIEAWQKEDSIIAYGNSLVRCGHCKTGSSLMRSGMNRWKC